jgi:hypothetical protein
LIFEGWSLGIDRLDGEREEDGLGGFDDGFISSFEGC